MVINCHCKHSFKHGIHKISSNNRKHVKNCGEMRIIFVSVLLMFTCVEHLPEFDFNAHLIPRISDMHSYLFNNIHEVYWNLFHHN